MPTVHALCRKLARLREADLGLQVFGAASHRYELSPRVALWEIEAFERQHSVTLPFGYRTFLLEAGNGDAGPGYGLFPLAEYAVELSDAPHDFLSRPFPHREPWHPPIVDESAYF